MKIRRSTGAPSRVLLFCLPACCSRCSLPFLSSQANWTKMIITATATKSSAVISKNGASILPMIPSLLRNLPQVCQYLPASASEAF
jgi:hypothetical protein